MDPESTDVWVPGLINHYIHLPDAFENMFRKNLRHITTFTNLKNEQRHQIQVMVKC